MDMHRVLSWRVAVLSLWQADVFILAMVVAALAGVPWTAVGGMLVLGAAAVWATINASATRTSVIIAWVATLWTWWFIFSSFSVFHRFDVDHLANASLIILGLFTASQRIQQDSAKQGWRMVALAWSLVASGAWLTDSYLKNQPTYFHLAIAAIIVLLVASRLFLRLPGYAIQFANTAILLLIALPLTDYLIRPSYALNTKPDAVKHYYSYAEAKKNPTAFSTWWKHFQTQWDVLHQEISMKDPEGIVRYRMRPGTRSKIFDSYVQINSHGFRGPEFERDKQDAYRIVTIGESTTFGCTITEAGKPWPRLLEELINERLALGQPVEVINAGVYGYTLEENVRRLEKRIMPFEPDMIISYHGYNFFYALNKAIPPPQGELPPNYMPRPLKLLADFEYRVRMMSYNKRRAPDVQTGAPVLADPMTSKYAKAYEELVRFTSEHGVQLVLANFSMSVNSDSKPEVIEFYRAGFPEVRAAIEANRIHSGIVDEFVRKNPHVLKVDTHPSLDGQHEKYIDLVHFTQKGREDMAETFFDAIKDVIQEAVSSPAQEQQAASEKDEHV